MKIINKKNKIIFISWGCGNTASSISFGNIQTIFKIREKNKPFYERKYKLSFLTVTFSFLYPLEY